MTEADCPDHLCMKQKAVDSTGGTIVCLPNKVVIEGEKENPTMKIPLNSILLFETLSSFRENSPERNLP